MPDGVDRQSLSISLAERYLNQNIGGAYDARKATTSTYNDDTPVSSKAVQFQNDANFQTNLNQQSPSNFKGIDGETYTEPTDVLKKVGTSTYDVDGQYVSVKADTYNNTANFQIKLNQQSPSNFKGVNGETYIEPTDILKKVGTSTYDADGKYISVKAQTYEKTAEFQIRLQPLSPSNFKGIENDTTGNASFIGQPGLIGQYFSNKKYKD